ncbi:MAG: hypothetical protein Ct9H300mP28_05170 [Pseudomonadota bacterium]|nr:MAG: hypothetical protein Ct9H300mP28_05170 [Pseudomonadota bacterium]
MDRVRPMLEKAAADYKAKNNVPNRTTPCSDFFFKLKYEKGVVVSKPPFFSFLKKTLSYFKNC